MTRINSNNYFLLYRPKHSKLILLQSKAQTDFRKAPFVFKAEKEVDESSNKHFVDKYTFRFPSTFRINCLYILLLC